MTPIRPFWFAQRQGKAEEAGENLYRLYGPIMREAFIGVRRSGDGKWSALVRSEANGTDLALSEGRYENELDAWYAAFELYRTHFVI
jgi:hypothetical protein